MKTPNWQPVKLKSVDGFDIILSFESDDTIAKHHFIDFCGWSNEEYKEIEGYYWFCLKVSVNVGNTNFSYSYLGGNAYASRKEALKCLGSGGLLDDIIGEAVEEAKENEDYIELLKHFKDN